MQPLHPSYRRIRRKHETQARNSPQNLLNRKMPKLHVSFRRGYNRLVVDAQPTWTQVGDSALLARFHGLSPIEAQARVTGLFDAISAERIEGVNNMHPAFTTLLVVFSPLAWTPWALVQRLEEAEKHAAPRAVGKAPIVIPFCCGAVFAPDLPVVCAHAGLVADEAIRRFSAATYHVAFLGFAPGFPYLLGLPPELATPRLDRPRIHVQAGSVGIAGEQTGIYPAETPGGWRIVGRTPLRLFAPARQPMSLLLPGDEVRFTPIDERRFEELSQW